MPGDRKSKLDAIMRAAGWHLVDDETWRRQRLNLVSVYNAKHAAGEVTSEVFDNICQLANYVEAFRRDNFELVGSQPVVKPPVAPDVLGDPIEADRLEIAKRAAAERHKRIMALGEKSAINYKSDWLEKNDLFREASTLIKRRATAKRKGRNTWVDIEDKDERARARWRAAQKARRERTSAVAPTKASKPALTIAAYQAFISTGAFDAADYQRRLKAWLNTSDHMAAQLRGAADELLEAASAYAWATSAEGDNLSIGRFAAYLSVVVGKDIPRWKAQRLMERVGALREKGRPWHGI